MLSKFTTKIMVMIFMLMFSSKVIADGHGKIKVGILHSLSGTMAISETTLKDTMLMLIEEQNKKGGILGRKLEPVVVDPASNWPLFAEKARELLKVDDFVEFIYEDKKKVAQITQINKRNKNIAVTVLNPEIGESTNWGLPARFCKKINKEDLDSYKNHNIEGF